MEQFQEKLEYGSTMGCITTEDELALYGYFMRMHSISLDTAQPYNYALIVYDIGSPFDSSPCKPIALPTNKFSILETK